MATMTYGPCACQCGEEITHEGSSYAGSTEVERNRHRAKAAYRRRSGQVSTPGTREALAELGMADDVPTAELAATVAAAVQELSRRVQGMDSAAIARAIETGVHEARQQAEAAETKAARAQAQATGAADELAAAIARADQADEDAGQAGAAAEELTAKLAAADSVAARQREELAETREIAAEDNRRAERAEALVAELRADRERTVKDLRGRLEAESAVALAELRAELTATIGEMRGELATVRAERDAERGRAERAEARVSSPTASGPRRRSTAKAEAKP